MTNLQTGNCIDNSPNNPPVCFINTPTTCKDSEPFDGFPGLFTSKSACISGNQLLGVFLEVQNNGIINMWLIRLQYIIHISALCHRPPQFCPQSIPGLIYEHKDCDGDGVIIILSDFFRRYTTNYNGWTYNNKLNICLYVSAG